MLIDEEREKIKTLGDELAKFKRDHGENMKGLESKSEDTTVLLNYERERVKGLEEELS